MNDVQLIGNLVKDPEVRTVGENRCVADFTLAVNRRFKNKDGVREADFINCVVWGKTAEVMGKMAAKGSKLAVRGSIRTESYKDKEGNNRFSTRVFVEEIDFLTKKQENPEFIEF